MTTIDTVMTYHDSTQTFVVPYSQETDLASTPRNLPSEVVVVRLRRRSVDDEAGHDGADEHVPWSHRWLVSGHWRNQWLPSRAAHRLQWISNHIKGPTNKPLIVKDRVTAWVR